MQLFIMENYRTVCFHCYVLCISELHFCYNTHRAIFKLSRLDYWSQDILGPYFQNVGLGLSLKAQSL